jgi:histidine ammonia-lyase
VLGIELLCGAQGVDFLAPKRPGPAVRAAHAAVRELSPHVDADRSLAAEIDAVAGRIRDGSLLAAVETGSAPLL